MNTITKALLSLSALSTFAVGCANADVASDDKVDSIEQEKIIGANDLTPVKEDGANVPSKYRGLINAFGVMGMGCTATHIGNGLVISAGHCFGATSTRKDNAPCNTTVKWGVRVDKAAYLTSTCTVILAMEQSRNRDYSIFKVSPVPPVAVAIDYAARPAPDTTITIFSHPRRRPLEWSQTCPLKLAGKGGWGVDQFSHQCDTEPGSSGATILDDATLKVVGIHDGGVNPWNYGTYFANTPIAEFVAPSPTTDGEEPVPSPEPVPSEPSSTP